MTAPVRLLYFAWLRARIGVTEEEVALPAEVVGCSTGCASAVPAMPKRCATCRSSASQSTRIMSAPTTRCAPATRWRCFRR